MAAAAAAAAAAADVIFGTVAWANVHYLNVVQDDNFMQQVAWTPLAIGVAIPIVLVAWAVLALVLSSLLTALEEEGFGNPLENMWPTRLMSGPSVLPTLLVNTEGSLSGAEEQGKSVHAEQAVQLDEDKTLMKPLILSQALFNRLVMLLGASLVVATGKVKQPSWIAAVVILLSVLRARLIEMKLIRRRWPAAQSLMQKANDVFHMLMASLENLDDYSDGVVIPTMFLQDELVHQRFIDSWSQSNLSMLTPLMNMVHMYGLAFFCLLVAQALQWTSSVGFRDLATQTELVGFGALSSRMAKETTNSQKTAVMGLVRVLAENVPSGFIASSFLMFCGVDNLLDQPVVLFSSVLSTFALLNKAREMFQSSYSYNDTSSNDTDNTLYIAVLVATGICTLLAGVWLLVKLWKIQMCPEHMWQLSSGCMES